MQAHSFAIWHKDQNGNAYREETLLQYGQVWGLLGTIILLNPGSATPLSSTPANGFLKEHYPYFTDERDYYPFSVDPLMRSLVRLFGQKYPEGGVIHIYNLFNLKNPGSISALEAFAQSHEEAYMMTPMEAVDFHDAPVIVATGGNVFSK